MPVGGTGTLERAFRAALRGGSFDRADKAVVELARAYAQRIDREPWMLTKLGPALLAALVQLKLTPHARAATKDAVPAAAGLLDELRARRAKRAAP